MTSPVAAVSGRRGRLPAALRKLPPLARLALVVLLTDAVIAAVALPVLWGRVDAREAEVRRLDREIGALRAETRQARQDVVFVQENAERYEKVLGSGLFDGQNRLLAQHRLDEAFVDNYLADLTYEFAAAEERALPVRDHILVATPLRLEAQALLDRDIFTLIRDLDSRFPGTAVLRGLSLGPVTPVTADALRRIRAGVAVPFFTATLTYEWRTVRRPAEMAQGRGQ